MNIEFVPRADLATDDGGLVKIPLELLIDGEPIDTTGGPEYSETRVVTEIDTQAGIIRLGPYLLEPAEQQSGLSPQQPGLSAGTDEQLPGQPQLLPQLTQLTRQQKSLGNFDQPDQLMASNDRPILGLT